jgi:hypothetical protein
VSSVRDNQNRLSTQTQRQSNKDDPKYGGPKTRTRLNDAVVYSSHEQARFFAETMLNALEQEESKCNLIHWANGLYLKVVLAIQSLPVCIGWEVFFCHGSYPTM